MEKDKNCHIFLICFYCAFYWPRSAVTLQSIQMCETICVVIFSREIKKRIKLMKLFDGNAANNKKEHAIKLHLTHFIGNRLLIEHWTMHGNYFMEFYRFILMHRFYCL